MNAIIINLLDTWGVFYYCLYITKGRTTDSGQQTTNNDLSPSGNFRFDLDAFEWNFFIR